MASTPFAMDTGPIPSSFFRSTASPRPKIELAKGPLPVTSRLISRPADSGMPSSDIDALDAMIRPMDGANATAEEPFGWIRMPLTFTAASE